MQYDFFSSNMKYKCGVHIVLKPLNRLDVGILNRLK